MYATHIWAKYMANRHFAVLLLCMWFFITFYGGDRLNALYVSALWSHKCPIGMHIRKQQWQEKKRAMFDPSPATPSLPPGRNTSLVVFVFMAPTDPNTATSIEFICVNGFDAHQNCLPYHTHKHHPAAHLCRTKFMQQNQKAWQHRSRYVLFQHHLYRGAHGNTNQGLYSTDILYDIVRHCTTSYEILCDVHCSFGHCRKCSKSSVKYFFSNITNPSSQRNDFSHNLLIRDRMHCMEQKTTFETMKSFRKRARIFYEWFRRDFWQCPNKRQKLELISYNFVWYVCWIHPQKSNIFHSI